MACLDRSRVVALAEDRTDVAATALGSPMRLDDVESGRLKHRAQITRGPAVGANDRVVERLDLSAIEIPEKESAAGAEDSRELEQWGHYSRRLMMNR